MKAFLQKWKPPSRKEWDDYAKANGHGPIRQYLPSLIIAAVLFYAFILYLMLAEPSSFVGRRYQEGAPLLAIIFPLGSCFYLASNVKKTLGYGGGRDDGE